MSSELEELRSIKDHYVQLAEAREHVLIENEKEIARLNGRISKLEADAKTDESIFIEIGEALEDIPFAGERTGPKTSRHLSIADRVKKLREKLEFAENLSHLMDCPGCGKRMRIAVLREGEETPCKTSSSSES